MKTIAFINNKGGVGKSSSVQTVAYHIAKNLGKRVLVVDIDPQGNTTLVFSETDLLDMLRRKEGLIPPGSDGLSVEDTLTDASLDIRKCICPTIHDHLDLLPAFPTLAAVEDRLKSDVRTPQQFRLKNQLDKVAADYDFCLIDCGPSLSILNINALVASDEVFVPTLVDSGSLWGVVMTIHELIEPVRQYSPKLQVGGIYITRCKDRTVSGRDGYEILAALFPQWLLPFTINENVAVQNANQRRVPLLVYDSCKRAQATKDFVLLAEYIAAKNRRSFLKKLLEEAG